MSEKKRDERAMKKVELEHLLNLQYLRDRSGSTSNFDVDPQIAQIQQYLQMDPIDEIVNEPFEDINVEQHHQDQTLVQMNLNESSEEVDPVNVFNQFEDNTLIEPYWEEFEESEICEPEARSPFVVNLAKWVNETNIARDSVNSLLKLIGPNVKEHIPKCYATLMKTPLKKIVLKTLHPGMYFHYGIQSHFSNNSYNFLESATEIKIDIGIDGASLFKSSQITIWPIMGAFVDMPNTKSFLIGCYCGNSKPTSPDDFLSDFVEEVNVLKTAGIHINGNSKKLPLVIRCFSGDAPARAYLSGIIYHNGKHGCPRCDATTTESPKTTYCGNPRTDNTFKQRIHPDHHNPKFLHKKSILEEMGIKMVTQFPIDPMHLVDSGVVKRCIQSFLDNATSGTANCSKISELLMDVVKPNTPSEFARNCRPLDMISVWKATEFRQFLLYSSLVVMKDHVDTNTYYHWLLLSSAIRLLLCPRSSQQNAGTANLLLKSFVENFPSIYGLNNVVYNVHVLLHLAECVSELGCLDSFSCYKFENFIQSLKRNIKKPTEVLQQIYKRMSEEQQFSNERETRGMFGAFDVSTKEKDSYCLITAQFINTPVKIESISTINGIKMVNARRCQNIRPFFNEPVDSASALGIVQYTQLYSQIEQYKFSDIDYKYFRIPYEKSYVLIPILHQTFAKFD